MKYLRFSDCGLVTLTRVFALGSLLAVAACVQPPVQQDQGAAEAEQLSEAAAVVTDGGDPGVYDDRIVFGQSAAFTGSAQELGSNMMLGIQAAFHEANVAGGVHGRRLELVSLDDGYEADRAFANTQQLVNVRRVFALIGAVGTPTSRSAVPIAVAEGVPFVAPFTGTQILRDAELGNVLNLRASYFQETEEMVARLIEDLGITRVAILYQNDSFGEAGLRGTRLALERRGLEPVASGYYKRNTSAVKTAVHGIVADDPEAIVVIGTYGAVAKTVTLARREIDPVFMTTSFVGSNALAAELGPEADGVYVTQVVPLPEDDSLPVVAAYHAALGQYEPAAVPGFVSLEGYLAGRLAVVGLEMCGPNVRRDCFVSAIRNATLIDIDGFLVSYGPGDNQGSDAVFLTAVGRDGKYRIVEELGGTH